MPMLDNCILQLQDYQVNAEVKVYATPGFGNVTYEVTLEHDGGTWLKQHFATEAQVIDHLRGLLGIINLAVEIRQNAVHRGD